MNDKTIIQLAPEINSKIAPYMKKIRIAKGMSAHEVGIGVGLSQSSISAWENDTGLYPIDKLFKIISFIANDAEEKNTIHTEINYVIDGADVDSIDFGKYKRKKSNIKEELYLIKKQIDRLLESLEVE